MSLQRAKYIDDRSSKLVYGYIRSNDLDSIFPMEICDICLLFYYLMPEYFIRSGEGIDIITSDENSFMINDIAQMNVSRPVGSWVSVQGNVIIDPIKNPNLIATWKFKINAKFVTIGIHSDYDSLDRTDPDYHFYASLSRNINLGDVITMIFNVAKEQLLYYKNQDLSKVIEKESDIVTTKSYHLALTVNTWGALDDHKIELIDFDVQGADCLSFVNE